MPLAVRLSIYKKGGELLHRLPLLLLTTQREPLYFLDGMAQHLLTQRSSDQK
jgi:hypothetical protein